MQCKKKCKFIFRRLHREWLLILPSRRLMIKVFNARSNWNLEVDFYGGRKTGVPREKPLKHRREPTNSTHISCRVRNQTRAIEVRGKRSHRCATCAPIMKFVSSILQTPWMAWRYSSLEEAADRCIIQPANKMHKERPMAATHTSYLSVNSYQGSALYTTASLWNRHPQGTHILPHYQGLSCRCSRLCRSHHCRTFHSLL